MDHLLADKLKKMDSDEEMVRWSMKRPRWGQITAKEWKTMTERMFENPIKNYVFWDYEETDVLWDYMMRFSQEKHVGGSHENYCQNWANVLKAYEYSYHTLSKQWYNPKPDIGLKEAIRRRVAYKLPHGIIDETVNDETDIILRRMNLKLRKTIRINEMKKMAGKQKYSLLKKIK